MNTLTAFIVCSVLMVGCTAHMMETQGDAITLFTPGGEKPKKGGVIRYLNTGLSSWREARRKDAENQMRKYCGGAYQVLQEGPRSKFGADMPIGKSTSVEVDQYTYVRFECQHAAK